MNRIPTPTSPTATRGFPHSSHLLEHSRWCCHIKGPAELVVTTTRGSCRQLRLPSEVTTIEIVLLRPRPSDRGHPRGREHRK